MMGGHPICHKDSWVERTQTLRSGFCLGKNLISTSSSLEDGGQVWSLPGIVLRSKAITPVPGHAKHTADAGCYFIFVYVNGCLQNDVQLYGDTSLFMHL